MCLFGLWGLSHLFYNIRIYLFWARVCNGGERRKERERARSEGKGARGREGEGKKKTQTKRRDRRIGLKWVWLGPIVSVIVGPF